MLVVEHPLFDLKSNLLVLLLFFTILICVLVNYLYRKRTLKANPEILNKLKIFSVIVTIVIMMFFANIHKNQLFYMIDSKLNNINESQVYIQNISANNQGIYIKDSDGKRYNFIELEKQLHDRLTDEFRGHKCTIKYYAWSKYVIQIDIIE